MRMRPEWSGWRQVAGSGMVSPVHQFGQRWRMNTEQTMGSLAPKVDAFALTLSAPEQVLLTELIAGGGRATAARFGARAIWPGLVTLISSVELGPDSSASGDGSRQPARE